MVAHKKDKKRPVEQAEKEQAQTEQAEQQHADPLEQLKQLEVKRTDTDSQLKEVERRVRPATDRIHPHPTCHCMVHDDGTHPRLCMHRHTMHAQRAVPVRTRPAPHAWTRRAADIRPGDKVPGELQLAGQRAQGWAAAARTGSALSLSLSPLRLTPAAQGLYLSSRQAYPPAPAIPLRRRRLHRPADAASGRQTGIQVRERREE